MPRPPRSVRIRSLVLGALFTASTLPFAQGQFVERAKEVGLKHRVTPGLDLMFGPPPDNDYVLDWTQTGMAIGDLDGDGDLDLIAVGGLNRNSVFRNDGGTFVDVTATAGLEANDLDRSISLGDADGDGDLDVFIGVLEGGDLGAQPGRSRYYINQGGFVFEERSALAGIFGAGHSLTGNWADFNKDGLLDLYVGEFHLGPNRYYENNGDGTFGEKSGALGIDHTGSAHSVNALDSNDDGRLDIFCGVDFDVVKIVGVPPSEWKGNAAFMGQSTPGTFVDDTLGSGYDYFNAPMGSTVADVDYDGDPDIYQSDIGRNPLFINNGWPESGNPWTRAEVPYGIDNENVLAPGGNPGSEQKTSGWAVFFMDVNLDPWIDLYVVNGHVAGVNPFSAIMQRDQQNFLFLGDGPPDFHFTDATATYGLDDHHDDRAGAVGDMDGDGDLDILVSPTSGRLRYYENQVDPGSNGWVIVDLVTGTSAPRGIGAVVEWTDNIGTFPHKRWIGSQSPTASQNDVRAHFGIGTEATAEFQVTFPSGMVKSGLVANANSTLTVTEPEMIRLSDRTLPVPAASLPGEPNEVTVTAFAYDSAGVMLDGTAVVDIDIPGLTATGPVVHVVDNEFERTFGVSTVPGPYRVQVNFDGWPVEIEPIVHLTGVVSPARSEIRVSPRSVVAGSSQMLEVLVAPKDSRTVSIGTGHDVVVQVVGVGLQTATDLGDGRYLATFLPAATPATRAVNVTVQGLPLTSTTVEFSGPVSAAQTSVDVFTPLPAQSATPHQMKVVVTPRDAGGRLIGPNADVRLRLSEGPSSPSGGRSTVSGGRKPTPKSTTKKPFGGLLDPPGTVRLKPGFPKGGQPDGRYVFVLEKTETADLPIGRVYLYVEGEFVKSVPFDFNPTH